MIGSKTDVEWALAIHAEATRLERDRVMLLAERLQRDVMRHIPTGSDTATASELFRAFVESVACGDPVSSEGAK